MNDHIHYIQSLIESGGPEPQDYDKLDEWISTLYVALDAGTLPPNVMDRVRGAFSLILSPATMHGFAYTKPHGYAGDFEIIDRHYLTTIAADPQLATWDRYWHAGDAARAVRNRKEYFHNLLRCHSEFAGGRRISVLNIASGPARDVYDFLVSGTHDIHFDCIDNDPKAIAHATDLCANFSNHVSFTQKDVLRFRPKRQYDLVWSAGLFDYFSDRVFKLALERLLPAVATGGELVIGNFSTENPNIHWLRFCDWILNHRSNEHLIDLATAAGAQPEQVSVRQEPAGVNLFLHIRCKEEC